MSNDREQFIRIRLMILQTLNLVLENLNSPTSSRSLRACASSRTFCFLSLRWIFAFDGALCTDTATFALFCLSLLKVSLLTYFELLKNIG